MPKTEQTADGEETFAVISPRTVRLFALSALPNLDLQDPDFGCSLLAQDVSYRLRQVIQLASLMARRHCQLCLTVEHVQFALQYHSQPSLGYRFHNPTQNRFPRVKNTDLHESEKFSLLLSGVAKSPLVVPTLNWDYGDCLVSEWLPPPKSQPKETDEVKPEAAQPKRRRIIIEDDDENETVNEGTAEPPAVQSNVDDTYLSALLKCLLNGRKSLGPVYHDLLTNNRLSPLLTARILALLMATVKAGGYDSTLVLASLRAFQCLLLNPNVSIVSSKQLFHAAVDFCLYAMTFSAVNLVDLNDDVDESGGLATADQILVREVAARCLAELVFGRNGPLLASEEVDAIVADRLISYIDHCSTMQAWAKCYGPLICLAQLATVPKLLGPLLTRLFSLADLDAPNTNPRVSPIVRVCLHNALFQLALRSPTNFGDLFNHTHFSFLNNLPRFRLVDNPSQKPQVKVKSPTDNPTIPSSSNSATVVYSRTAVKELRSLITIRIVGCQSQQPQPQQQSSQTQQKEKRSSKKDTTAGKVKAANRCLVLPLSLQRGRPLLLGSSLTSLKKNARTLEATPASLYIISLTL